MSVWDRLIGREERREATIESPGVPVSAENFMAYFGVSDVKLARITVDTALGVPAVAGAVGFLSGSMANLPLHAYQPDGAAGAKRVEGRIQRLLNEAPNPEWTSFGLRKYFWQQVFTGGRGLAWIERDARREPVAIWPMEPNKTTLKVFRGRRAYHYRGVAEPYAAADVIDVPFMLKADQVSAYSPIKLGAKAIQLSIAMTDYGANFFAGGGVPPLALSGPLPQGAASMSRAMADIGRAIDAAKDSDKPVFPIPPGHELKPVGFDPAKGQMTEAKQAVVVEIARVYNLPPIFLQDLTHGTFTNSEQQDLHLVKHLITQWSKALEEEINLKVFGLGGVYAEHNLNALMRGDFKSRIEALARGVQSALLTPDEARGLDNRGPLPNGDKLYIQGATVPLGTQPVLAAPKPEGEGQ